VLGGQPLVPVGMGDDDADLADDFEVRYLCDWRTHTIRAHETAYDVILSTRLTNLTMLLALMHSNTRKLSWESWRRPVHTRRNITCVGKLSY
jgi:hypothetical protein